jgi:hypothetical protein
MEANQVEGLPQDALCQRTPDLQSNNQHPAASICRYPQRTRAVRKKEEEERPVGRFIS